MMIECREVQCRHNSDGICTHNDPELTFDAHDIGQCLSYEIDWRKGWGS